MKAKSGTLGVAPTEVQHPQTDEEKTDFNRMPNLDF